MSTKKLGSEKTGGNWVQTDRLAHERWARLIARKPKSAQLLHVLVGKMGHQNAVVVSQKILAGVMGCSVDTVRRGLRVLKDEKWIQIVRIGRGREAAYVVNDRVAWGEKRGSMPHLSVFSATVYADSADQDEQTLEGSELLKIPVLYPGEHQSPVGDSGGPPSQGLLEGMEPDLPAIQRDAEGRVWEIDPVTGEAQQLIRDNQETER